MKNHVQTLLHNDERANKNSAVLFVTRFSAEANDHFLRRLFSAYGHVRDVQLDQRQMFAKISYPSTDDADTAVAVLHLRYETVPGVSLIVLYDKASPRVSQYGRTVGAAFAKALADKEDPVPIPLAKFDPDVARGEVQPPPEPTAAFFGAGGIVPPPMPPGGYGGGSAAAVAAAMAANMWGAPNPFTMAAAMGHHHHMHHHMHGGFAPHQHHHMGFNQFGQPQPGGFNGGAWNNGGGGGGWNNNGGGGGGWNNNNTNNNAGGGGGGRGGRGGRRGGGGGYQPQQQQ